MSIAHLHSEQLEAVDRIWHLRQTLLLEGLSVSDLNAIASVCRDRIYSKGEVIFHQGDPVEFLYILNRGFVRVSLVTSDDRQKCLEFTGCTIGFGRRDSQQIDRKALLHDDVHANGCRIAPGGTGIEWVSPVAVLGSPE